MRKIIALLALAMVAYTASAQIDVHDYLWISTIGPSIYITSTVEEELVMVPPKEERREITSMQKASMKVVQEYEARGWVLYSFDTYQHDSETTARSIWIMRKPK